MAARMLCKSSWRRKDRPVGLAVSTGAEDLAGHEARPRCPPETTEGPIEAVEADGQQESKRLSGGFEGA